MENNNLQATIWKACAAVLITLVLCITASCQNTKWTLKKMVEAGVNPMTAACALGGDANGQPTTSMCIAHELNKSKTDG